MAFRAGTTAALYISTAAGSVSNVSPYADSSSLTQDVDQLDVSVFGSAAKAFLNGQSSGQFQIAGPLDAAMHTILTGLAAAGSTASWIYGPGGSVASQPRMAGSLNVANISYNSNASGRMEYSASLQLTGAIANGTF